MFLPVESISRGESLVVVMDGVFYHPGSFLHEERNFGFYEIVCESDGYVDRRAGETPRR